LITIATNTISEWDYPMCRWLAYCGTFIHSDELLFRA
jgi:hypothetical protein